jgi:hypothetical protein
MKSEEELSNEEIVSLIHGIVQKWDDDFLSSTFTDPPTMFQVNIDHFVSKISENFSYIRLEIPPEITKKHHELFLFLTTANYFCTHVTYQKRSNISHLHFEAIEIVLSEILKKPPPLWDQGLEKGESGYLAASQYFYSGELDENGKEDLMRYYQQHAVLR